jgi:hypothetical protein
VCVASNIADRSTPVTRAKGTQQTIREEFTVSAGVRVFVGSGGRERRREGINHSNNSQKARNNRVQISMRVSQLLNFQSRSVCWRCEVIARQGTNSTSVNKTGQEMGTACELKCSKQKISLFGFWSTAGHSPRKGAPGTSGRTSDFQFSILNFEFRIVSLMNQHLFV